MLNGLHLFLEGSTLSDVTHTHNETHYVRRNLEMWPNHMGYL